MPGHPASEIDAEIGRLVRTFRLKKEKTLAEMALAMGISLETLSLLERGLRRWGAEELIALSNLLNFSIDEEFGKQTRKGKKEKSLAKRAEKAIERALSTGVTPDMIKGILERHEKEKSKP